MSNRLVGIANRRNPNLRTVLAAHSSYRIATNVVKGLATTVIAPYTKIYPEARAALPYDAVLVDTSASDGEYWKLLSRLWADQQDVIIIEHDIVASDEEVEAMRACREPWCSSGYQFEAWPVLYGLGFTRFSGRLMEAVPDALLKVERMMDDVHPSRHWCALDARLTTVLVNAGFRRHAHGMVTHLKTDRTHTCGSVARS